MSDILSRLVARAQGSPTSLARRVRYRFAPVDEHAEGWAGYEGDDAVGEVFGTPAREETSNRSRATAPAEGTEVRHSHPDEDKDSAVEPTESTIMVEQPPATRAIHAARSEGGEAAGRFEPLSTTDTHVERSSPAARLVSRSAVQHVTGLGAAASADVSEDRPAISTGLSARRDARPSTATMPHPTAPDIIAEKTSQEPGATSPMRNPAQAAAPGRSGARTGPARPAVASPPANVAPVAQLRADPTIASRPAAQVPPSRLGSVAPIVESGHTGMVDGGRAAPRERPATAPMDLAPVNPQRGESTAMPPVETIAASESLPDIARSTAPASARSSLLKRGEDGNRAPPSVGHVPRQFEAPDPSQRPGKPVGLAPSQAIARQPEPTEGDIASVVLRYEATATPHRSPGAALVPAAAPRVDNRGGPLALAPSSRAIAPPRPAERPRGLLPARPPATERPEQASGPRQAVHDRSDDRPARSRHHSMEHSEPARPRATNRSSAESRHAIDQVTSSRAVAPEAMAGSDAMPPHSFPDTRGQRRASAPRQATPMKAPASNEIHIEIGRIQIDLPRARPQRSRPEPPLLQGKPRRGPEG